MDRRARKSRRTGRAVRRRRAPTVMPPLRSRSTVGRGGPRYSASRSTRRRPGPRRVESRTLRDDKRTEWNRATCPNRSIQREHRSRIALELRKDEGDESARWSPRVAAQPPRRRRSPGGCPFSSKPHEIVERLAQRHEQAAGFAQARHEARDGAGAPLYRDSRPSRGWAECRASNEKRGSAVEKSDPRR